MATKTPIAIFWFRRDLRLTDNAGLYHALKSGHPVVPLFIFDRNILDDLADKTDARVTFIHQEIARLKSELEAMGSTILVKYGDPRAIWQALFEEFEIASVYTNHDFEPYAKVRDTEMEGIFAAKGITFRTFKDHVIFQYDEVLKDNGEPYVVFTPYSRKWKDKLASRFMTVSTADGKRDRISYFLAPYPNEKYFSGFLTTTPESMISLGDMGFEVSALPLPTREVPMKVVAGYDQTRDFPALAQGTTHLGLHFRFGTISIREKARKAQKLNETYLNELIWRDFYSQIMGHFPHVADGPFRPAYRAIAWRHAPDEFAAWCAGKTGYPIVDAGMRELAATGFMHNRVRMITASFLTKHLLINWQEGEAWFAQKLLDFDLASNNGGWQWAAGCGTDAAPYFRIFNPEEQMKRFDAKLEYVRRWVPEYGTAAYPKPIVDHKFARERCLQTYKACLADQ